MPRFLSRRVKTACDRVHCARAKQCHVSATVGKSAGRVRRDGAISGHGRIGQTARRVHVQEDVTGIGCPVFVPGERRNDVGK